MLDTATGDPKLEERFEALAGLRDQGKEAASREASAKATYNERKKEREELDDEFKKEFDHLTAIMRGEETLPLFANQTDKILEETTRPDVMALCELLEQVDYKADPLLIAGFTEHERNLSTAWAQDVLADKQHREARPRAKAKDFEMPTVLLLDGLEPETLRAMLESIADGFEIDKVPYVATIEEWSTLDKIRVREYINAVLANTEPLPPKPGVLLDAADDDFKDENDDESLADA